MIDIDVTKLPAKRKIKGSYGLGVFLIIFSLVWGGGYRLFLQSNPFSPAILSR
ncbi:MAG: hypothetical protein PHV17_05760 [Candidatus Omnitrophica bacterium]|nr:hypothetical protein [Candidatus Omnitrophota bacterium]